MEYRLETSAAFDVLVRKQTFPRQQEITSSQVPQFWAQCHRDGTIPALCQYISADGIFSGSIIGVCFGWNGEQTDFPYGIGVPYHGQGITDPRLHIEHIPAQTYLVFPVVGKMPDAFHTLYTKLYTEFFPASEYFPCGAEIEVYPSADTDAPDFECELWIAVEKKK